MGVKDLRDQISFFLEYFGGDQVIEPKKIKETLFKWSKDRNPLKHNDEDSLTPLFFTEDSNTGDWLLDLSQPRIIAIDAESPIFFKLPISRVQPIEKQTLISKSPLSTFLEVLFLNYIEFFPVGEYNVVFTILDAPEYNPSAKRRENSKRGNANKKSTHDNIIYWNNKLDLDLPLAKQFPSPIDLMKSATARTQIRYLFKKVIRDLLLDENRVTKNKKVQKYLANDTTLVFRWHDGTTEQFDPYKTDEGKLAFKTRDTPLIWQETPPCMGEGEVYLWEVASRSPPGSDVVLVSGDGDIAGFAVCSDIDTDDKRIQVWWYTQTNAVRIPVDGRRDFHKAVFKSPAPVSHDDFRLSNTVIRQCFGILMTLLGTDYYHVKKNVSPFSGQIKKNRMNIEAIKILYSVAMEWHSAMRKTPDAIAEWLEENSIYRGYACHWSLEAVVSLARNTKSKVFSEYGFDIMDVVHVTYQVMYWAFPSMQFSSLESRRAFTDKFIGAGDMLSMYSTVHSLRENNFVGEDWPSDENDREFEHLEKKWIPVMDFNRQATLFYFHAGIGSWDENKKIYTQLPFISTHWILFSSKPSWEQPGTPEILAGGNTPIVRRKWPILDTKLCEITSLDEKKEGSLLRIATESGLSPKKTKTTAEKKKKKKNRQGVAPPPRKPLSKKAIARLKEEEEDALLLSSMEEKRKKRNEEKDLEMRSCPTQTQLTPAATPQTTLFQLVMGTDMPRGTTTTTTAPVAMEDFVNEGVGSSPTSLPARDTLLL